MKIIIVKTYAKPKIGQEEAFNSEAARTILKLTELMKDKNTKILGYALGQDNITNEAKTVTLFGDEHSIAQFRKSHGTTILKADSILENSNFIRQEAIITSLRKDELEKILINNMDGSNISFLETQNTSYFADKDINLLGFINDSSC